jgi:hypothetical protein
MISPFLISPKILDAKSLKFDTYNIWCGIWYIPTSRELYIVNNDSEIIAKFYIAERTGMWPMWMVRQIVNIIPEAKKAEVDSIIRAWALRVADQLVDTHIKSPKRSAILDNNMTQEKNPETRKPEIVVAENWDGLMKFIVDNRPIVVYQFWIDTTTDADCYTMLYSKVIPAPDSFVPSEV